MVDFKTMIENESIFDVISFFSRSKKGIGYPKLDNFFVRYRFEVISSGEFMRTFAEMEKNGVVQWGEKMIVLKGPNWKEPKFVTQKKYGIE